MAQTAMRFDSLHSGPVHCLAFDAFGSLAATAGADEAIRLWNVGGGNAGVGSASCLQELRGHVGPVWQVAWAHPRFGAVFASSGHDGKVVLWQQQQATQSGGGGFVPIHSAGSRSQAEGGAPLTALAFAPEQAGLVLAAGSADGEVLVLTRREDSAASPEAEWRRETFVAHFNGVHGVAFAPWVEPDEALSFGQDENPSVGGGEAELSSREGLLMATGGADCCVRFWVKNQTDRWEALPAPEGEPHGDWVRDVAFRPRGASGALFGGSLLLASGGEDCCIKLWVGEQQQEKRADKARGGGASAFRFRLLQTLRVEEPVWRLTWSASGSLLAAAVGDAGVLLLREGADEQWQLVSDLSQKLEEEQRPQQQQPHQQQQQPHHQQQQQPYGGVQQQPPQQAPATPAVQGPLDCAPPPPQQTASLASNAQRPLSAQTPQTGAASLGGGFAPPPPSNPTPSLTGPPAAAPPSAFGSGSVQTAPPPLPPLPPRQTGVIPAATGLQSGVSAQLGVSAQALTPPGAAPYAATAGPGNVQTAQVGSATPGGAAVCTLGSSPSGAGASSVFAPTPPSASGIARFAPPPSLHPRGPSASGLVAPATPSAFPPPPQASETAAGGLNQTPASSAFAPAPTPQGGGLTPHQMGVPPPMGIYGRQ